MKKGLRRVAVAAVATLVVAPALATVASATSTFAFDRLQGNDRYITSAKVADAFGTSTSVILANGTNAHTVDALAAAYLAGAKHAPILLTTLDTTPTDVIAAITKTGATTVYLAGETGVISAAQATALDATFGTVTRLGGIDRFATAKKLIAEAGTAGTAKTAIVTTGMDFPDALGAGPLSYAKGMPIGITYQNSLPADTLAALKGAGVTNAIVLGGPTVVSQTVLDSLVANGISLSTAAGVTAGRIFGADRAETSSKLADFEIATQGFSNTGVNVATGDKVVGAKGADALGGAALSGKETRPTLITNFAATPGAGVLAFLTAHANTLASGHIYGGVGPITPANELLMTNAAKAVTSNQTYSVTPGTAASQATQTSRTYTVSGLTVGTAINIDLVDATQVSGSTFVLNTSGNRVAKLAITPSNADITIDQINGVTVGNSRQQAFTPTLTSLTFRVTSRTATATEAVPVVFAGTTDVLNVNLDGVPTTQAFGTGGMVTFTPAAAAAPAEAANGVAMGGAVTEVVGSTGFRTGAATQFVMRAGDTYQFGGTAITMAQFLSILSVGDTIGAANYINPTTVATPNTFNITTDLPLVAAAPVATSVGSLVTVKYTPNSSISANGTTVTLQRASVVSGVTGAYATVKTGVLSSLDQQVVTETLADGNYSYRLIYTAPAFSGLTATSAVGLVTVDSTLANNRPTIQRVYLTSNATAILTLSSGDVFKVVTDAPMVQPLVGATLTVGTLLTNSVATATAAGSATFTVNTSAEVVDGVSHAAGTVLTVKLLADMVTANQAFPTSVSASFGIANAVNTLTGFGANSTLTQDVVS